MICPLPQMFSIYFCFKGVELFELDHYHLFLCTNIINTYLSSPCTVRQFADICLFSTAQYKCTVAEFECE